MYSLMELFVIEPTLKKYNNNIMNISLNMGKIHILPNFSSTLYSIISTEITITIILKSIICYHVVFAFFIIYYMYKIVSTL